MNRIIGIFVGLLVLHSTAYAVPVPAWDRKINGGARFTVLASFGGEAVRDNETGLVWFRDATLVAVTNSWFNAIEACLALPFADRYGWRLPTIEELESLNDPTNLNNLPVGHPFTASGSYWSGTTSHVNAANAYHGAVTGGLGTQAKSGGAFSRGVWCVRGGHGYDGR